MLRRSYETLRAIQRIRKAGVKVVWVLHNLHPHEASLGIRLNWAAHRWVLCRLIDGFITLSPSTIAVVRKQIPGLAETPAAFAWHPPYPIHLAAGRTHSRNEFGLPQNATVFAHFGFLRHYKGLESIVDAFRKLKGSQYRLLIGGQPKPDSYANEIAQLIASDERITLIAHRLSDRELGALLETSDIVVLPFKEYLHSGSIVHALCHRRTVLTPETPYASDLQQLVGADWIQTYTPPLTAEILRSAHRPDGTHCLDFLSTEESGARLVEFFESLLDRPVQRQRI
ncbi:MAG: glycosyltransferase [Terracidiphilus sp.]